MARMSAGERRALLVEAAIRVMCREGIEHTTTRMVVAEAGMQIGVFHYCFRSKEELILEVMETSSRRMFEAVADSLTSSSDPAEIIRRATRDYWADIHANPLQHMLNRELTQHALRRPGEEGVAVAQYAGYAEWIEVFLAEVASIGGFTWRTPVDQLARFTLAVIEGVTIQWLVGRDERMSVLLLDQLAEHLCADAGLDVPADRSDQ